MVSNYRDLIRSYFKHASFVKSNLESFNNFLDRDIQRIIGELEEIVPTIIPKEIDSFRIKFGKITIEKPIRVEADGSREKLYPMEARLRKLTYSAAISVEVKVFVDGVERESYIKEIGKVPVMVRSKYCHLNGMKDDELIARGEDPHDTGGYFILNGNERVLITVEDLVSNKLFIEEGAESSPSKYSAKLFSEAGSYRVPHTIEQMKDGVIYFTFTRFRRVPILSVVKALGLVKDQDIMKAIAGEKQYDSIYINLLENVDLKTEDIALDFLAKKIGINLPDAIKLEKTREQLDKYLLPHLGTSPKDRMTKAYNICKMVKRFLNVVEENHLLEDKDHFMNKRLKLSGDLLADLFRVNLKTLIQDILYNYQRLVKRGKFQSTKNIIRDELLTSRIKSAMATGTWVGGRKGVSQNIDRTNYLSALSHSQRVVSLLESTQENFEARELHATHFGRLCPVETPEGTPIGLRKNLALLCEITQEDLEKTKIKKALEAQGLRSA